MPIKPPKRMTAKLEEKLQLNDKFVQYSFELTQPHRMEFEAGQYVSIQVSAKGERRSYSITSSPTIKHGFELVVDHAPQGLGCAFLENLEFGTEVDVLGPLGIFTIPENTDEDEIVLVATGSGIAPFYSMIQDLLQVKNDKRPIYLYWGLRYVEDLFWQHEFQSFDEHFENFTFQPILSQPPEGWNLSNGRVTDFLTVHDRSPKAGYYICGSEQMILDAKKILLIEKNVPEEYIHHEKFY